MLAIAGQTAGPNGRIFLERLFEFPGHKLKKTSASYHYYYYYYSISKIFYFVDTRVSSEKGKSFRENFAFFVNIFFSRNFLIF